MTNNWVLKSPRKITSHDSLPPDTSSSKRPWYNCCGWGRRMNLIVSLILMLSIVGAVAIGSIEIARINRYPDYASLNYQLVDVYEGISFFEGFNYFTEDDPTGGFVVYVNKETAEGFNLTYATELSAVLRVDTFTINAPKGRNSVRIESKNTFDSGLFIFDIIHSPYGCGTWPALWLTDGYNWPNNGEIDILESNNQASQGNEMTLHTTPGCHMKVKRKETGSQASQQCDSSVTGIGNGGCGVIGNPSTYGKPLNDDGGGIYALELREEGIRIWFFPRHSIPTDIHNASPDPSTWGTALADFPGTECDISSHFRNQSIIANIDLCGELAGQKQYYTDLYNCPGICEEFVASNPAQLEEAYWEFKSFKVYQGT
ncbi:hypothetical protein N7462_010923 [Penicillium macrosclerotiorum]|uniref:uncharacterized protein n=1 Tax=Penicillium macrosclerotiorum TaxID=303699 RepID=UPI002549272D|nr:uncharacterized protein N7462_010923 [Penicillium macrosclerotiorum]KAJ5669853.1 hypothetical protein N7462_010923 [Penicillium macrosclerotiorum]